MNIEAMRQARNAFVWNLNTDLDNISSCEQWANMLRKNIDALDKAIADAELKWVGLTDEELLQAYGWRLAQGAPNWLLEEAKQELLGALRKVEASIKEKNS